MSNNTQVFERIADEIKKIEDNNFKIYFFAFDTEGVPSGCLSYIYKLAKILHDANYNVNILGGKQGETVGAAKWLGEEYTELNHSELLEVSPSDILFIPEILVNYKMSGDDEAILKKLPCKKILIFQNTDWLIEQIPIDSQLGDYGVMDAIVNTKENEKTLNTLFPYVKTTVIDPFIDIMFGDTITPKDMVVNIVTNRYLVSDKIAKMFFWTFPSFRWVSFKTVNDYRQQEFASELRDAEITIWVDESANFGYSAIEAMKSGSLVIAKVPDKDLDWMLKDGKLVSSCIWFNDYSELPHKIATAVRSVITNSVPVEIKEEAKTVYDRYNKDNTKKELLSYVTTTINKRKAEMEELSKYIKTEE
jgi:hypothetical protein